MIDDRFSYMVYHYNAAHVNLLHVPVVPLT